MTRREKKPEKLRALKKIMPLVLISIDDRFRIADEFNVDIWCAEESDTISSLFKDEVGSYRMYINSKILRAVLDFCEKRAKLKKEHMDNKELQLKLEKLGSEFIKKDQSLLIDYVHAAYQLKIRSLFDLASTALFNLIDGKDDDEIIKVCNLREILFTDEKNFTDEKIQWYRRCNGWAFV